MVYETNDLVLGAYLNTIGYKLSEIKSVNNKGTFIFSNVDQAVIDDYYMGKARVDPVSFNTTLRQLVTAVRSKS
jgi:hypothetical protein